MNDDTARFLEAARRRYVDANAATLRWLLSRTGQSPFLDTKMNSITLADYTVADGWRGPAYVYGWIQGRGLESLITHASFFDHEDPELAGQLDVAARSLHDTLADLFARHDRHAYFTYDGGLTPVIPDQAGNPVRQSPAQDLFTYSDAFVIKGLIAASARFGDPRLASYVERLFDIVAAVEEGRFVTVETRPLDPAFWQRSALDFGPWMILLGAAGLLRRLGIDDRGFGARFIAHVLNVQWDGRGPKPTDLVRDHPEHQTTNPGHAIEFVGFAHETLPPQASRATIGEIDRILHASFRVGFRGPGIVLSVDPRDGAALSPNYPWWSLPETIRAAALAYERTSAQETLEVWRRADDAFFTNYWRGEPPVAYQTRNAEGPVEFVPATPDLDPGYHTGLSLLGAIEAINRIQRGS